MPMELREVCGTRSCFVVLRRAQGAIRNRRPASEIIKNQYFTNAKIPISTLPLATNQGVGRANLSGRAIKSNTFVAASFGNL